jgi:non-ribosomal peptide synthetase-like protein
VAVPVGIVCFCLIVARLRSLVRDRIEPGIYKVESVVFLRTWLAEALTTASRVIMRPIYGTAYLPPWLRLMGARVGRHVEVSTVSHLAPDLVDIEDGSFVAEDSSIGGRRFFRGRVEIGRNRIGRGSFISIDALLPVGASVGRESLIGALSTMPDGRDTTPDGTEWFGSPPFRLPHRAKVEGSDEPAADVPTWKLRVQRVAIDAVRVLFPAYVATFGAAFFFGAVMSGLSLLPAGVVLGLAPVLAVVVAGGSAVSVVALKHVAMGRYEPATRPLRSTCVWWNGVVTGAYETISARVLSPLVGTPFFNAYLRQLGCKVGKHAFIDTTRFSGFDLIEVGDHAAVNHGVVVRTQLSGGGVLRSSHVRIGDGCSVGNASVLLYDTEMGRASTLGPLSLLMTGGAIPRAGRHVGIPAGRAAERPAAVPSS